MIDSHANKLKSGWKLKFPKAFFSELYPYFVSGFFRLALPTLVNFEGKAKIHFAKLKFFLLFKK